MTQIKSQVLDLQKFERLFLQTFRKILRRKIYADQRYKKLISDFVRYWYSLYSGKNISEWDIQKGIYLFGRTGTGKTSLFQAMAQVLMRIHAPISIRGVSSMDLAQKVYHQVAKGEFTKHTQLNINFVDDFMREAADGKMNVYGTKIIPSAVYIEWAYTRYRNRDEKFFFTSNFPPNHMLSFDESLDHAVSRIYEMCNIIQMPDIGDLRVRFASVMKY